MTSTDKPFLASKKARLACIGVGAIVAIIGMALYFRPSDSGWQAIGLAFMAIGGIIGGATVGQAGVDMIAARNGITGPHAPDHERQP